MGDTLGEITSILEKLTNTSNVPDSVAGLLGWFSSVLKTVAASPTPAQAAEQHAAAIEDNKDALAAAVTANT